MLSRRITVPSLPKRRATDGYVGTIRCSNEGANAAPKVMSLFCPEALLSILLSAVPARIVLPRPEGYGRGRDAICKRNCNSRSWFYPLLNNWRICGNLGRWNNMNNRRSFKRRQRNRRSLLTKHRKNWSDICRFLFMLPDRHSEWLAQINKYNLLVTILWHWLNRIE